MLCMEMPRSEFARWKVGLTWVNPDFTTGCEIFPRKPPLLNSRFHQNGRVASC